MFCFCFVCGTPTLARPPPRALVFDFCQFNTFLFCVRLCAPSLSLCLFLSAPLFPFACFLSLFSSLPSTHVSQQLEPLQFNCYKLTGRTNVSRLLKPRAAFELLLLRDRLSRPRYLLSPVLGQTLWQPQKPLTQCPLPLPPPPSSPAQLFALIYIRIVWHLIHEIYSLAK